jgi:branched-chain amino acid transport system substrate-binding protein
MVEAACRRLQAFLTAAALLLAAGTAAAQVSDGVVRIGVLNDQSGLYADLGGPGSVTAARMAAEDAGGKVLGQPVEIVAADHQNKADIGANIARQWFDEGKVDMAVGFDNSAVALAVQQLGREKNRIVAAMSVATPDITGKACSPTGVSWIYDSYALTTSLARSVVGRGLDSWFFITVDYTFGHALEADTSNAVRGLGGKVLGSVKHPLSNADFSSYLLQAQASGAKVIALANGGGDMMNATKQATEFGIAKGGQTVVSLLAFITDIHSLGLAATQGLTFVTGFYWDRDEETRGWSRRFLERHGKMPTMGQAATYSEVRHYLRAVEAAKTDDPLLVMAKMRETKVDDFYARNATLRPDGRLVHDMLLVQVKRPDESKYPWDYYKILSTVAGDQAFRPVEESGCPLVVKKG